MKTLTLTLALFGLFVNMQSQVIEYTYDAAGNRTQRRVIVLKKNYTDDTDSSKQEVVQEQLGEWQFNMYPNPVKEQLTISIKEKV